MKKLYINILYHQHQPLYKDPVSGYYLLPWTRLHAIKDYYDMLIWVEKYENLKLNFNFVPSLLVQLEDYAKNAVDKHLELTLKHVNELTDDDKVYILKEFFNCNYQTMLFPYKRYLELYELRGKVTSDADLYRKIKYFNKQDWIDLRMWSNLVWFDPYWRRNDNEIKQLFDKEKNFTEEDVHLMVRKQREICSQIIKKAKQLQDENKIEISFSPFYHPILPLLCDPTKAKVSNPKIELPKGYLSLIEDADAQIRLGKEYYEKIFGSSPKGMWPSEGSVSEDIIPLLTKYGIQWCATDEEILKNSIYLSTGKYPQKEVIYKHYILNDKNNNKIYIFFRDREISDNIGFVYYRWNHKDAVKDIQHKLKSVYETVYNKNNNDNTFILSIILDGENCWEFYPEDGHLFLDEFYQMLTSTDFVETVLVSDFIKSNPNTESLQRLWPGSWINANYNIWIGHYEDNTGWEYLYKVRKFLTEYIQQHKEIPEEKINICWHEIYAAEGSDWYWWFGEEHYSSQQHVFDLLFRQHLKNIYLILQQEPPSFLDVPVKRYLKKHEYYHPSGFISPVIDGKISNYFEWSSAGKYEPVGTSMHQTTTVLKCIYFGFDLGNLYIRGDYDIKILHECKSQIIMTVYLLTTNNTTAEQISTVKFVLEKGIREYTFAAQGQQQNLDYVAIDKIIEIKIPFCLLKTYPGQTIRFFVTLERKSSDDKYHEIQRLPNEEFVTVEHPDKTYFKKFWTV